MSDEPAEFSGEEENKPDDGDWENRTLCDDESCIGVIGPDGRCKECGRPYGQPPTEEIDSARSDDRPRDDDAGDDRPRDDHAGDDHPRDDDAGDDHPREDHAVPPIFESDDDWENRTLCSDESCIGVIGRDGRCKECGKPYEG